jgi:2-keto-3-deoxy-6-phosphogluconate aldolase
MKFAFLIMGEFDPAQNRSALHGTDEVQVIGVSSLEDACQAARELKEGGVECIELCGAFEEAGARQVIQATGGNIPVGYVVHLPEQDALFAAAFGAKK